MVNNAANEPADEIITWMMDDVRALLKYKRETDEEFKKRFGWSSKNQIEGSKAKIWHSQGSVPTIMWAMKLLWIYGTHYLITCFSNLLSCQGSMRPLIC